MSESIIITDGIVQYQIIHKIGKGAYATVYKVCYDGQFYACKVIKKTNEKQKESVEREINIVSKLDHPNIVKLIRTYENDECFYLFFEYCERGNLATFLKARGGKILEYAAQTYLKQIVDACDYLKDNNILHRDIKLQNLFVDDQYTIKLGDFGLARQLRSANKRRTSICGTPNYLAPEIVNREEYSFLIEIWSLGVILYTMLVGQPPFETLNAKSTYNLIRQGKFQFPEKNILSEEIKALIVRLLQVDPEKRPSMWELSQMLPVKTVIPFPSVASQKDMIAISSLINFNRRVGIGYRLNNGTVGIVLNHGNRIWCVGTRLYYQEKSSLIDEEYSLTKYPEKLNKLVPLLESIRVAEDDEVDCDDSVYVEKYVITNRAMVFQLSHGTSQLYMCDGTMLIYDAFLEYIVYENCTYSVVDEMIPERAYRYFIYLQQSIRVMNEMQRT